MPGLTTTSTSSYNVAIIGMGSQGYNTWFKHLRKGSKITISAVCDSSTGVIDSFVSKHPDIPAYTNLGELLKHHTIDFAVVCAPNKHHVSMIEQLAAAGVSCLKEKPVADSFAEFDQLCRIPTKIGVSFQRRWQPRFVHFRNLLPTIGKPLSIRATLAGAYDPPQDGWRVMHSVGTFDDLGVHMLDAIVWLFGRPSTVYGLRVDDAPLPARDRESHIAMTWTDLVGHLHVSEVALQKEESLIVRGEQGSLHLVGNQITHYTVGGRETFHMSFQTCKEDTLSSLCEEFGHYAVGEAKSFAASIEQLEDNFVTVMAIRDSFASKKQEIVRGAKQASVAPQVSTLKARYADMDIPHNGTVHNGSVPNGSAHNGTVHNGSVHNGSVENGTVKNGTLTNGSVQNGIVQSGSAPNGSAPNGSVQNGNSIDQLHGQNGIGENGILTNGTVTNGTGENGHSTNQLHRPNGVKSTEPIHFVLNTGDKLPALGFGTRKTKQPDQVYTAVTRALAAGYRHVDSASRYNNEDQVGRAVRDSGLRREEVWITTKVDNSAHDRVAESVSSSLAKLEMDYIDLLLMHWPVATTVEDPKKALPDWDFIMTWQSMQKEVESGRVRNIGVSNFGMRNLKKLLSHPMCSITPAVNQLELHPCCPSSQLIDFCNQNGIHCTAYSPLACGLPQLYEHPNMEELCKRTGKTPQQLLIRWGLQRGTSVIPKTITPERILTNFEAATWELTPEEHSLLSSIENRCRVYPDDWLPAQVFWEEDD